MLVNLLRVTPVRKQVGSRAGGRGQSCEQGDMAQLPLEELCSERKHFAQLAGTEVSEAYLPPSNNTSGSWRGGLVR